MTFESGRIVILGTGYVASTYARALHFLGLNPTILSRAWLDYHDIDQLQTYLRGTKPQLLINCAGFTGRTVDDCEWLKQECYHANVVLPRLLGQLCADHSIPLVHISSGCIFTGPGVWKETDKPNNLDQFYAQCKAAAENEILITKARAWIFRIRMPFSHVLSPRNWLCKLRDYPLILDGQNSVTFLDEFCMRSYAVVQKAEPGIYHAAYTTPVSTRAVAQLMMDMGARKIPIQDYPPETFAKFHCPRSTAVLDSSKFEQAAGAAFGDPMCALRWCIQNFRVASRAASRDV